MNVPVQTLMGKYKIATGKIYFSYDWYVQFISTPFSMSVKFLLICKSAISIIEYRIK